MGSQRVGHDWATSLHSNQDQVIPANEQTSRSMEQNREPRYRLHKYSQPSFLITCYWRTVALQCCVHFCRMAKQTSYTYTHIYSFFRYPSHLGHHRALSLEEGNPLQYSCLENPMDTGVWWAAVIGWQRVGHNWMSLARTQGTEESFLCYTVGSHSSLFHTQ